MHFKIFVNLLKHIYTYILLLVTFTFTSRISCSKNRNAPWEILYLDSFIWVISCHHFITFFMYCSIPFHSKESSFFHQCHKRYSSILNSQFSSILWTFPCCYKAVLSTHSTTLHFTPEVILPYSSCHTHHCCFLLPISHSWQHIFEMSFLLP